MNDILKKKIQNRQKDLSNTKLLIAAGKRDIANVRRLIEGNADVNFIDTDGNTALHYAVESGSLDVVQMLLDKVEDTGTENEQNETPLDTASKFSNKEIIEALGQEIINKSFMLLKEAAADAGEADDTALTHIKPVLNQAEEEIRNTEDKIKYCLDAIDKPKGHKDDDEDLSYEEANVIIYFLETFALEGSCDEDVKSEVKKHFSQCYSDKDRRIISDARTLLFKKSNKRIRLEDVRKFVIGDVSSFFCKLKAYVQRVHDKLSTGSNSNEIKLSSFLNVLEKQERDIGEKIDDTRTFLKAEFEKIIAAAYGIQEVTSEELFNFTMNFYPAFKKETNSDFKELQDMRNKLIHEFQKYGYTEFGNAIYSLRSRLFKYYYAQEVFKIISSIEPDENPETINRNLEKQLLIFKKQFKSGYGAEQVISQEDAKCSLGYVFSHSVFPERDDSGVEELVDQYLKFMVIIDSEEQEACDMNDTGREIQEGLDPNLSDVDDKSPCQHKELSDVERRQIFEKFARLKRIKHYCSKGYREEKKKLRYELTKFYGVNGYNFNKVCSAYVEHDNELSQKDKRAVQEISKTINNLKKLKDNYQLSNQVIISLYEETFEKQGLSVCDEHQTLLRQMDQKTQQEILKELRADKTLEITIGNEAFCIRTGKIVSNMLKTFYNAYHKYQVEFNVEEIFNDDIFLDYLARTEIKEKDIVETVDAHFKLLVFISSRKQRQNSKRENHDDMDVREVFGIFKTLKKWREHFSDQDYNNEKELLKKKIIDKNFWLNCYDFDRVCELFIEEDNSLQYNEIKEAEKLKRVINNLKSLGFSWQILKSLYERLVNSKGNLNLEEDLSLLRNCTVSQKIKVKDHLEKLYAGDLAESKISVTFGNDVFDLPIWTVVPTVLEIFNEELQFKKPFFTYVLIRKLLNIDYCAPYIVKLITEVKNDDIIEKNDLLRLINVLLNKEEGSYIKHVHALLTIRSGKLNLYEEICSKIIENNTNIANMRIILKDPEHVINILNILKGKAEPQYNAEKTKFVELIKDIFKLLNNITLEMCRNLNYDVALKILEAASAAQEKLIHGNMIEEAELNVLGTKSQIGRIKNRLGMQEPEKPKKVKLHREALTIFEEVCKTLGNKERSNEKRQIKAHEMPLFLLILSEIAYTKRKLEMYEQSCAESENLYQEVVRFVLDLPRKNRLPGDFLNGQTYSEIEKSKRYQELLSFSEESKKYLDVLNIKSAVAHSKATQGLAEATNKKYDKAISYYGEALTIYKDIYAIRKQNPGSSYRAIIPVMRDLSYIYSRLASLHLKNCDASEDPYRALQFCFLALEKEKNVYASQKDMIWPNYSAALKSRSKIIVCLRNIGQACSAFAEKLPKEEGKQWYEKSIEIFENIYDILVHLYGEKHSWTKWRMSDIESTRKRLGKLECWKRFSKQRKSSEN